MRLSVLLKDVEYISVSGGDPEITSLEHDSRRVTEGAIYFCLSGIQNDGHAYAKDAVKNGAAAIVVERLLPIEIPQILTYNSRITMSQTAANFFGNPGREMTLIGITGTNGKTTTSFIVRSILEAAGYKTGLIGTTAVFIGAEKFPATLTTPDPVDLNRILRQMADNGVKAAIMEVSAHALYLNKIDGLVFDYALFSNLSQDHLDFFGNMGEYKAAKKLFFNKKYTRCGVVNVDDACGREIIAEADIPCFSYGCENPADVFSINYKSDEKGLNYVLNAFDDVFDIKFRLPGRFNMYNTLCAATVCCKMGINLKTIAEGISGLETVPGRFNVIDGAGFGVIVDYAHTPDGLLNILKSVREIARGRVITVFGCGGNRDESKRAKMGHISALHSDYTVITSDNPRFENPDKIITDIEDGMRGTAAKYVKISSRPDAIKYALRVAKFGDIVLIAGKGDERYQDINGQKLPYYDVDEVKRFLLTPEKRFGESG